MDEQIKQYEQIADQIDQESLHVIQRQKAQIKNIQNHLTLSQARLSVLEQQKVSDQQTIDIQGRTLSEQLTKNQKLQAEAARLQAVAFNNQIQAQQVPLLQAQLNDLANQNRAVVQDAVQLHIDKETLQTQARSFLAQKQQLIQAMSLQERTLADKDKDLQALAMKCRGLFDDNKALAQKCQEHRYAWQEAAGSCRKLLKDTLLAQNLQNRTYNDNNWLLHQLSRLLDQNLLIARQLGANPVCRKMRAICKAIRFIKLLHGAVKNGIVQGRGQSFHKGFSNGLRKIDKVPDQELTGLARAQDPLRYLNIAPTIPRLKNQVGAIPRDQLEDVETLRKMDERFGTNRISHLLQKAIEAGQERNEFSREAKNGYSQKEHLQKRAHDMEIQVQRLQSELMKEVAEKEKIAEQLINEQKNVTIQNEQLTELHNKLAQFEREQTRELQEMKQKLHATETQAIQAQAQVTHLTSALDQKQREHLRLMRDFERANVRARVQMDQVQDARAVIGQVAGEQALAEKRRRLSALQERARAASVVV